MKVTLKYRIDMMLIMSPVNYDKLRFFFQEGVGFSRYPGKEVNILAYFKNLPSTKSVERLDSRTMKVTENDGNRYVVISSWGTLSKSRKVEAWGNRSMLGDRVDKLIDAAYESKEFAHDCPEECKDE